MDKIINNRKFRLLLACISLLILVDLVQDTYAKYVSSADANTNFTIARWAFTVNSQDIVANNNFSSTITPVFDQNAHIGNNVIAPTSTGHFQIVVYSSNVGVSFDETITLSNASTNTITDLKFTGYKKNNDPVIPFQNNQTTITETHLLGEANTVNTYTFYIEWIDGTGESMDNADDTQASIDGVAAVHVNINFIQKASQPASSSSSQPANPSQPSGQD